MRRDGLPAPWAAAHGIRSLGGHVRAGGGTDGLAPGPGVSCRTSGSQLPHCDALLPLVPAGGTDMLSEVT